MNIHYVLFPGWKFSLPLIIIATHSGLFSSLLGKGCHFDATTWLLFFYFDCVILLIVTWENSAAIVLSHIFMWKQKQTKRFITNYKNSQLNQYQAISFCTNLRLNWSNWLMLTQISILQNLHLKVHLQVCKSLYIYIHSCLYNSNILKISHSYS